MSSRDAILKTIKENRPTPVELPDYDFKEESSQDLFETFKQSIQSVGGDAFILEDNLDKKIKELFPEAKITASAYSGFKGTRDPSQIDNPKKLADIDLAVVEGEFAVAENGAVWVQNSRNKHRGLYFIAQNIIIIVKRDSIVSVMENAYEKISFENSTYGTFISGPSKTADIEQSLVIGAHGPKEGIVLFV